MSDEPADKPARDPVDYWVPRWRMVNFNQAKLTITVQGITIAVDAVKHKGAIHMEELRMVMRALAVLATKHPEIIE